MTTIRLPLGDRSYNILIGSRILSKAGAILKKLSIGTDAVIITNPRLARLYSGILNRSLAASGISARTELVPDSEKAKSISVAENVLGRIAEHDTMKKVFIVALGGGVTGDLAGFLASVYKRGIPYVQIPTTLLAQVDSAIGGKVALDLPVAKNMIGAFHQPSMVISDTGVLATLPRRQLANGLAEIIKYGVIRDAKLFAYLEKNYRKILSSDPSALEYVISRSSAIKAAVVARDEHDIAGIRAILNYGHTIGHAIEAAAGYSGRYNHGEAVAIGMVCAGRISFIMGMIGKDSFDRIYGLVRKCGLPTEPEGLTIASIMNSYRHDKKFVNKKNRLVLPTAIGRVRIVEDVPEKIILDALKDRRCP